MPRSVQSAPFSDSSIISISSSNDSGSNPIVLNNLDNCTPSLALSTLPSPPIDLHSSFNPPSRRQSFGEGWDSGEGVYKWEDDLLRPPSPTDSLVDHIHEISIRNNSAVSEEDYRGRSRSPRLLAKSRSRSRGSSRSSRKKHKSPTGRPKTKRQKSKSPAPSRRSSSHRREKSSSVSRKAKARVRSGFKSRSRSSEHSPKARRRIRRNGNLYAPEDDDDGVGSKDLDARLLDLILQDKELYLRILRYEPIKFEDILNMAIENGVSKHGLPVKLKAFLDSQCINFYSAEALGRKKKRHA